MKISELINKLERHPNSDAEIIVITNFVDSEDENYDIDSTLAVFNEDCHYEDFIELHVTPNTGKTQLDTEDNVRSYLNPKEFGYSKVIIEIDPKSGVYLFGVTNSGKQELQREMEFNKDFLKKRGVEDAIQALVLRVANIL